MKKYLTMSVMALQLVTILSLLYSKLLYASVPEFPEKTGPYQLQTIEFRNLHDTNRDNRQVPIKIHLPIKAEKWPVVIFSHGAGGHWDANIGQAKHLASYGYAVLCVEHIGSNTEVMKRSIRWLNNVKAMTRDANEVLNRPKDISFAIDRAIEWNKNNNKLKGRLDTDHIGVIGHSFGSYTTLAILGARPALNWLTPRVGEGKGLGPDLSDQRVKAGIALSPQGPGEPFFLIPSYSGLRKPVLGITGSKDKSQSGDPESRRQFFKVIPPGNKMFIWLNNADHTAFSDSSEAGRYGLPSRSREEVQPIARATTLLFFEGHLRGDAKALEAISEKNFKRLLGKVVDGIEIMRK